MVFEEVTIEENISHSWRFGQSYIKKKLKINNFVCLLGSFGLID